MKTDYGAAKKDDAVILAGDFNSLGINKGMNSIIRKGFADAFKGLNFTAQTWKPSTWSPHIAGIDYILFNEKTEVKSTSRFVIPGSDHCGIMADIVLKD